MTFKTPLGFDDFRLLRREGRSYVDKSAFVGDVIRGSQVTLFPRPRRFGKTLNLSMLRYFFEDGRDDRADLFEDLAVWRDAEARAHFGRYPVILLSLKSVRGDDHHGMLGDLRLLIAEEISARPALLDSPRVSAFDRAVLGRLGDLSAGEAEVRMALKVLSSALASHHEAPVILLLDEYDTPIQHAWLRGYYREAINFFRTFLGNGFKGNPHLYRGVLTGILRLAKESIFSDLNNLTVHSMLGSHHLTRFGFTDSEVADLAARSGLVEHLDGIRDWYDGYRFGPHAMYNPWSVLHFMSAPDTGLINHWVGTSANALVKKLLTDRTRMDPDAVADLLRGRGVDARLDEHLALLDIEHDPDAVWSLLYFSGYLTTADLEIKHGVRYGRLVPPNRELAGFFTETFARWLQRGTGDHRSTDALIDAILAGDARRVQAEMNRELVRHFSFHDTPRHARELPYHAFMLGLLARLSPTYDVQSNREAGRGRADLLIVPRDPTTAGVVLELKALEPEREPTPEAALDAALAQIEERGYADELHARGIARVHRLAVVFHKKAAYVRAGGAGGGPAPATPD